MFIDLFSQMCVCSSLPLVTIVIPIYNVEKYIRQCLESVIVQTYKNLEILCVDDKGSDGSIEIVNSLLVEDSRIRILRHNKNLGLGPARNTGIKAATGEFIYFLDSDDWIKPGTIENLVKKALLNKSDIVIGAGQAFVDADDISLKNEVEEMNDWLRLIDMPEKISLRNFRFAISKIPCVAWGKLYRSDFIVSNSLIFINEKICHEDDGFHVKCMACEPKISIVNECGYQYRIRSSSLMNFGCDNSEQKIKHVVRSIGDALGYLQKLHKRVEYVHMAKDLYWKYFAYRKYKILLYWGRYFKIVRIWRIILIKQTWSYEWVKFRVFGIVIWRWRVVANSLMR